MPDFTRLVEAIANALADFEDTSCAGFPECVRAAAMVEYEFPGLVPSGFLRDEDPA